MRIGPSESCQVFKALGRYEVADLFMHFPNRALKESLIGFAMTAKQTDLAGQKYAGDIVSQLKEESPARIDYEGGSNFPVLRWSHGLLFF
jgi:hypothetical protein